MKKALLAGILLLLPSVAITAKQTKVISSHECLTANIFFEARGESTDGMKAVAKVTMNRVKSKKYPSSVCKVVFQKKQFSWTHQQNWDRIVMVMQGQVQKKDLQAYQKSATIAKEAVKGQLLIPQLSSSLWYHASYVKPKWSTRLKRVAKIGVHIFYA